MVVTKFSLISEHPDKIIDANFKCLTNLPLLVSMLIACRASKKFLIDE